MADLKKKLIISITGASGAIYAKLLLEKLGKLSDQWEKIGVIMSANAKYVWQTELGIDHQPYAFADYYE